MTSKKTNWQHLKKLNVKLLHDLAIILLGISPEEQNTCALIIIAPSLTIVKR